MNAETNDILSFQCPSLGEGVKKKVRVHLLYALPGKIDPPPSLSRNLNSMVPFVHTADPAVSHQKLIFASTVYVTTYVTYVV